MFTLWYSVLSWKEYSETIPNKACTNDAPKVTPINDHVTPQAPAKTSPPTPVITPKPNNVVIPPPPPPKATPPTPVLTPKANNVVIPPPPPPKASSPLPVPVKSIPRPAVTPPRETPPATPIAPKPVAAPTAPTAQFGKMEQMEENRLRNAPAAMTFNQKSNAPATVAPKLAASNVNSNFIKRENSYSSEEEAEDEDEEDEGDDSEIERIDIQSK